MKGFLLGILFMFSITSISKGLWYYSDNEAVSNTAYHTLQTLTGQEIVEVLTEKCTNQVYRSNGATAREWFQCNKVQIFFSDLIYGEKNE